MFYYKAILKESVLYYFYKETNIVVHVVENKRKIKLQQLYDDIRTLLLHKAQPVNGADHTALR